MAVKRLRAKQRGPSCSWCSERASHRGYGSAKFSCPDHLSELEEWDRRESTPDYSDAAFYGGY